MAPGMGFLNPKNKLSLSFENMPHLGRRGLLIHEKILEIINWDLCSLIFEIVHSDKHEIQFRYPYKHTELGSLGSVAQEVNNQLGQFDRNTIDDI